MITLQTIADMQEVGQGSIRVNYFWKPSSNKPMATLAKVWITFIKPSVETWKYLMSNITEGFEIGIGGTRNGHHESLDDCYVAVLDEVNRERAKLGLKEVWK